MKQTKKLSRKVISYVLALVMVFSTMTGIVPGMSITAQAAPKETLLTTITATGKTTYSESPEGVVNVTLSNIVSYRSRSGWFGGRVTVTPVEGYTITKCRFNANSGAVNDTEEPFTFNNDRNFVKTVEVYGYQTSAQAADPVPYIYYTNNASTEGTCTDYTTVATDTTTWGTAGNTTWYVVSGEVTISSRVTVNGTVNLILRDGAKLTVNGGIGLNDGNTLNIYPETENGTGELNANASSNKCAGIGGTYASSYSVACGTLTIHGGVIKATGAENGPGIGNSGQGYAKATQEAGTVIIYAGNVTATGGNYGSAGIGGGWAYTGGCNVEIYGGTVLANVGDDPVGAQGIGYAGGSKTRYPGTLKIGAGVKVYSDAAGTTEIAAGPQDNVASRTDTMFVKKVKLAQTVTAPTKATDLTYKKDEAQALLTSGAVVKEGNKTEGSIKYKVGDDGTWSSEIPKETNAGTYSVYYKVEGNDTYAEYAPADPISVTIAKADPETPEAFSAIYGQQAKDIKLPTGWSWVNPDIKFESSGGVELKANFEGDANYNQKNNVSIYGTVAKAAAKISYTFSEVVKEYGSKSFTNEITNTGDVTPTYISSATSVATVDNNGLVTIKGIGETTITANVAEDNDHYTYETRKASYKLIVNPVSTVINTAPTATDITYGQKLSESTLSGGVVNVDGSEDTVAGTFAWKEPDLVPNASDSGEYEVVFTPTDTNYAKSTCNVKVKVNKKTVSATELEDAQKPVAKTGDDTVYTGEQIELVTAPTTNLPLDYEAYYSTDNGETWSTGIPKKTDPGTYTVKVKYVSKSGNCNDIILGDITVNITPADKKALTDAIAAAKEYYDTIKGNTDYSEAADKLDKAIKAAEEVAKADKVTKADVSAAAEAVTKAKATAEAEVKDIDDTKAAQAVIDKINELKPVENIKPEDRTKIEAAREAYKKLTDDQKTKLTGLDSTAVSTLEAAEQALDTAEKAAFDAEKEAEKKAADALAADGDSDASKKLIEDAKKAINELAYDKSKSVDENKAALAAIVSKLKSDLTDNRAAEKKEADDTAAAKKVTDAINALPASDKVATTDKAAIEAARKAYDALTADQKKKVPADVLKKLTDAETALKAAEKKEAEDAANAATAKKVVDAINKLPVASKVTVPNKAAIEAARKAYNSLTAEQKKNVPADVLKKLTDDEKALAAATAADKAAKELAAAKEEAQAAMNEQVTVTQKGKKFTVKWKKSTSADGYYVYASYCGKKATKPAKTIKKNTTTKVTISKINGKKISTKKNFHVYVVPYKIIDGKKVALGKSTVVHLVGAKSTKYSNVKKLTLKKTKYTVKVGKTAKIKAKVTLVNKNKKHIPKSHGAKFRYKSSDTSIATVDKNGKIKGIKKGKCTIYVYSINGLTKKAQITVK